MGLHMPNLNARQRAKYAAARKDREGHPRTRDRFSMAGRLNANQVHAGDPKTQRRLARTLITEGPYRGRTALDQHILASVHIAIEDHMCPDHYLNGDKELDRLTACWFLYHQNLNL